MPSVEDVAAARARFWSEQQRFQAKLATLMRDARLQGRWVVFLDDKVQHDESTREAAHRWAIAHLDRLSGFVVAEVAEPRVVRVGGARRSKE